MTLKPLLAAFWRIREAWTTARIYGVYLRAGHETPWLAAQREIAFRAHYLERFRDFASDLAVSGISLDAAKSAFIKKHLTGRVSVQSSEDTTTLRNIILYMPADEAYHPEAFRAWQRQLEGFATRCSVARQDPLVTRVLRGKA